MVSHRKFQYLTIELTKKWNAWCHCHPQCVTVGLVIVCIGYHGLQGP